MSDEHDWKADLPILLTLFGISKLVRPELENAKSDIAASALPASKVNDVSDEHDSKAYDEILVTVFAIIKLPLPSMGPYGAKATPFTLALYIIVPINLSKEALFSSIVIEPEERPGARNALEPTVVRALGLSKITDVSPEHW